MLFKNTAAQSADLLTAYLFSLLLAPLMLDRLGLALFGVWAVTGALATYAGLADLGITRSLARFVALYDVQGDRPFIAECVGLGLVVTTAVTAAAAALAVAAAPLLASSLGVLGAGDLRLVLLAAVAIYGFTTYRRVLGSVAVGLRQMVPANVANVFTNALNFVFSVGILLVRPDLVAYGAANALSYLIGIGAALVALRHVWGSVPVAWPSRERWRAVLGFGVKTQLHAFADLVNLQTDKIVLAFVVGVRAAAGYEIAARVVLAVRSVGLLTISAMIPTVTAHIARHGRDVVPWLYGRYTRLTVGLSFPVFALTCLTAPFLLRAWLDAIPAHAAGVVVVLTLGYLPQMSCVVAMNIATADGRPGLVASTSLIVAALNIALTVALAPVFGFWGILGGTVVALAFGGGVFVVRFHGTYVLPLRAYVGAVVPPAALALLVAAAVALGLTLQGWDTGSRATSAFVLLAAAVAYAGLYWPLAGRLGFIPEALALRRSAPRRHGQVPPVGIERERADV
jgi:O-antigen/teichoic acid export membrane protein